MAKKPRENRVPIMLAHEELEQIDDWRFKNRIATRSEAIRRLCHLGMAFDHRWAHVEAEAIYIWNELNDKIEKIEDALDKKQIELFEGDELTEMMAEAIVDAANSLEKYLAIIDRDFGSLQSLREGRSIHTILNRVNRLYDQSDSRLATIIERHKVEAADEENGK